MADTFRERALAATRVVRGQEDALKKRIAQLYTECAKNMEARILHYGEDSLTGRRADVLQKSMRSYVHQLWQDVDGLARNAVQTGAAQGVMAQASVLDDALHGYGITTRQSFASMFGRTQDEAVASVLNGTIYKGKHAALSRRIWNNEALQSGQIEQIIARAVAEGRSATQLARDLEAYVNPKAMMPDNWNDIYEGLPFAYKVDYNAKRLAVTALNHGYYQGALMAAREDPFVDYLHWELSSMHLIYDVCDTYMEHDEGLGLGNYALDSPDLPLPHPFCRCTWYYDTDRTLEEIGDEIGRWIGGEDNGKLEKAFGNWRAISESIYQNTWQGYRISEPVQGSSIIRPDPELVKRVQSTIDRITEDFPELQNHLEIIEFSPEPGIGASRTDGKVLRFDNNVFHSEKSLKQIFDESIRQEYTVNASDPMFIVAHECGHALENLAAMRRAGINQISILNIDDFRKVKTSLGISYFLNMGFTDESAEEIYQRIGQQLGKRALDDPSEMMAQAVADCYFGNRSHSLSENLVKYLKTLLRE